MSESSVFNGVTGSFALSIAFAGAVVSMIAYLWSIRTGNERLLKIGRMAFHVTVISFMMAAATLMFLIFTHQYQYEYVWHYSSNFLSKPLLMASFYAGQQGSFMLWTLFTSIVAVFVLGYAQRVKYEAPVMGIFAMVISCLLLILIVDSPFMTIFEKFPNAAAIPTNGRGLNPTLENLWITIHPPILFSGFAAMTVPFVFAIAGLLKRDYQRWITVSLPWALFASMVLGFGIMLGGWWAYETLGWGGFWGWDPVENSSLIPWLVCVALVHTMLVQKRTGSVPSAAGPGKIGALVKTNYILAVFAFGLILYSTFLTRSGILGDTSVHSFVEPGKFVYAVLMLIIFLFIGIGVSAVIWRWKDLRQASMEMKLLSRENALALGSAVLMASAMLVLIGTSYPIFLPLFDQPKVAIQPEFYNVWQLPIAFAIVLLNGLSMTLKWRMTTPQEFFKKISWALLVAAVGTVGLVLLGVHDPVYIALGFGSVLALVINIQIGWKILRGNRKFVGAYISHSGVALLMLGIIFTARYSVTQHVQLVEGEPKEALGYTLTYTGRQQVDLEKTDREKFEHKIVLKKGNEEFEVRPVTFVSDFNNRQSPFMEPGILYYPTKDIYVSPKALETVGGDPYVRLRKGDRSPVPFDSSVTVRFDKFDMSRAGSDGLQGAVVEVKAGDSSSYLTLFKDLRGTRYMPERIPGTDISVGFAELSADRENLANSQAIFTFKSPSHPPGPEHMMITVDVSIKPFISFVWTGVIIMVGGFFFSVLRRRKEVDAISFEDETTDRKLHGASAPPRGPVRPIKDAAVARTSLRQ